MISFVVPVYNSESTIQRLIQQIKFEFPGAEVIVVEDGSTDQTRKILNSISGIIIDSVKSRQGKGDALNRGFTRAKGDVVVMIDADLSIQPKDIHPLIDALVANNIDAAIGSRRLAGAQITQDQPVSRKFVGTIFSQLHKLIFGWDIVDSQCGAKAFKKSTLKKTLPLSTKSFAIDIELLWKLKKLNANIVEIPIKWTSSQTSSVNPAFDGIKMFIDTLRIRFL